LRQARAIAILEKTGAPAARAILARLADGRATSLHAQ
jgi:hypothetical protein